MSRHTLSVKSKHPVAELLFGGLPLVTAGFRLNVFIFKPGYVVQVSNVIIHLMFLADVKGSRVG